MIKSHFSLYESYRNSYKYQQISSAASSSANASLNRFFESPSDPSSILDDGKTLIEMNYLPPSWLKLVDQVIKGTDLLKGKISELGQLYAKSMTWYDQKEQKKAKDSIHYLRLQITKSFENLGRMIAHICFEGGKNKDYLLLTKNISIELNSRLSALSLDLQNIQNEHLKYIEDYKKNQSSIVSPLLISHEESDLVNPPPLPGDLLTPEMAQYSNQLHEPIRYQSQKLLHTGLHAQIRATEGMISSRDEELKEIESSLLQINSIMKNLNTLVIEQDSTLDRIDCNIENFNTTMDKSVQELHKGAEYQKSKTNRMVIILLSVFIFVIVISLILKSKSSTTNPETL